MKMNSMLESKPSEPMAKAADPGGASGLLRFPAEDDSRSLTHMAQRDLDAALQLLAQRAQYITAASGAAVALRAEEEMICRASAGTSAPGLGSRVQVDSGLSGESVRTRQILRCDNADTDPRVNRETCQALGIASVIVMPLVQNEEVIGVFELFSERTSAFEERDVVALQRIAEMIMTAVEHANAATRTDLELRTPPATEPEAVAKAAEVHSDPPKQVAEPTASVPPQASESKTAIVPESQPLKPQTTHIANPQMAFSHAEIDEEDEPLFAAGSIQTGKIGKCSSCGFPVSEGRVLCLDCETAKSHAAAGGDNADFLANFGKADQGWFASHKYIIVALVLAVVLLISVVLRFR